MNIYTQNEEHSTTVAPLLSEPVPIFREEVRWGRPWEGGEGVYIARYMLGIDIDYSNPNVQFSKGQGGITEVEQLTVFPNPATNNLTLSFANAIEGGFVIEVYNHTGVKVINEVVSQTEAVHLLNTTKLKNGIYFIKVYTSIETFKSKFVIIK